MVFKPSPIFFILSPFTLLNLVTNLTKASALVFANSVVSLLDEANFVIKLDILVPTPSISDKLSFKSPKSISSILANAFMASVEAFTLSTLSLPNVPILSAYPLIPDATVGNLSANLEISLSPVNKEINPPEFGISSAALARAVIAFPAASTVFT